MPLRSQCSLTAVLRSVAAALLLATALLPIAPAMAGSQEDPEVTDAPDDAEVTRGPAVVEGVNQVDFPDVEIVSAWFEQAGADEPITLVVQVGGAPQEGLAAIATLRVQRGPTSVPASSAAGAQSTLAVFVVDGETLRFTFTPGSVGASGGDELVDLVVATSRADEGANVMGTPAPIDQDDQSATDTAGPGLPFTVVRQPPQAAIDVTVANGIVLSPCDDCLGPSHATDFTGGTARAGSDSTSVHVNLTVRNAGTDPDAYSLSISSDPPLADPPALSQELRPLAPGASEQRFVMVSLEGMEPGTVRVTFTATTEGGGSDSATLDATIDSAPLPPPPRKAYPDRLEFLSPAAVALGLDDALGKYAEMFLLAVLVLVAIVAIYLAMNLGRRARWNVRLAAPPAPASAEAAGAPPESVGVRARGRAGSLRGQAARGGHQFGSTGDIELEVNGPVKDESQLAIGTHEEVGSPGAAAAEPLRKTRRQAPPSEPVAARTPGRRTAASSIVAAATGAASSRPTGPGSRPDVRLERVRHEPPRPRVGEDVSTTATLRNLGDASASLRVVLLLDGEEVVEERVEVPGKGARTLVLPWTASAGQNQVAVQVFPA